MNKHTPGPWGVGGDGDVIWSAADSGGLRHEVCFVPFDKQARRTADGRLIAAAPELLEALQAIADLNGNDYFDGGVAAVKRIASNAIAKVTGETPDVQNSQP